MLGFLVQFDVRFWLEKSTQWSEAQRVGNRDNTQDLGRSMQLQQVPLWQPVMNPPSCQNIYCRTPLCYSISVDICFLLLFLLRTLPLLCISQEPFHWARGYILGLDSAGHRGNPSCWTYIARQLNPTQGGLLAPPHPSLPNGPLYSLRPPGFQQGLSLWCQSS